MPDQAPRYDVFLSHNSADKPAVEELARRLIEAGLQPFLDKWHLIPGAPWQEGLENALADSASAAIFIGPSGISPWHNEEMRDALDRAVRSRDDYRVISVLLPGADETAVARFLARRTWVDFRTALDDAEAFDRLVAGIQGQAIDIGPYRLPDEPAPYRGLLPFEAEHARFFFGRDADIARLVEKLGRQTFVAVVGASGSGKSSLVKAGLLPRLKANTLPDSGRWQVLTMTPGSQPLRSLADQLATFVPLADRLDAADKLTGRLSERTDGLRTALNAFLADRLHPVLLFIDQFEELFTLCADDPERCRMEAEQFIVNLADAAERGDGQFRVILTLRADFLDRCLAYPALRKLLEDHQLLLGPLAQADLRDAIVRPAQLIGAMLEKGLVNTILADVGDEPGNLPLLQHALHELWLARRGPWLTLDAYEASGGVAGALGRRAQATYDALTAGQQTIARAILLRLTTLGEGVSDTRRRAERAELYPAAADPVQVDAVIEALSGPNARLVVAEVNSVELAHEALIQGWSTLRGWLEESREALRTHRRMTDAANEWAHNRDESYLYRGVRLAEAEGWIAAHGREMNALEAGFVEASLALRDGEAMEREAIRQRELKQQRSLAQEQRQRADAQTLSAGQLRRLVGYLAAALLVAIVAAVSAGVFYKGAHDAQRSEAEARHAAQMEVVVRSTAQAVALEAQDKAEREAHRAKSNELAVYAQEAISSRPDDPSLALILAREALMATFEYGYATPNAAKAALDALSVAPPWHLTLPTSRHIGRVAHAAFNPDGKTIATVGDDQTLRIWDTVTGMQVAELLGHTSQVNWVAYRKDGKYIVTASDDRSARVWDIERGEEVLQLRGHTGSVKSAAYSPDAKHIVTASDDSTVRVWDAVSGVQLLQFSGHAITVHSAVYSPDGKRIVTAGCDRSGGQTDWYSCAVGTARIWDAENGEELLQLQGHKGDVYSAEYSPDGKRIVTTSVDWTVRIWDAENGQEMLQLADVFRPGISGGAFSPSSAAVFSPDGRNIVTNGGDLQTMHICDAESGKEVLQLHGVPASVTSVAYSPDGKQIVTTTWSQSIVWNAVSGEELVRLGAHTSAVNSAVYSPNGEHIATGSTDGTARIWDTESGEQLLQLLGHTSGISSVAFSPGGDRVVTASWDKTVRVWEVDSGKETLRIQGHTGAITSAAYSPDGMRIVTASYDQTARVWDAVTGWEILRLTIPASVLQATYSPDGQHILTANDDQTARVWDVSDGQEMLRLQGHTAVVASATYSPDGKRIVTVGNDGTARVWDAEKGTELVRFQSQLDALSLTSVAYSPNDDQIVTTNRSGTAQVWDIKSGQEVQRFRGQARMFSVAYSPNGKNIVTGGCDEMATLGCGDGTAHIWDVERGSRLLRLEVIDRQMGSVAFSPNGSQIVSSSGDVWDVASGKNVLRLVDTSVPVTSIAFSPDGKRLVSNRGDIWDTATGEKRLQLHDLTTDPSWAVDRVAYSPDGKHLLSDKGDVWEAETGKKVLQLQEEGVQGVISAAYSPDGKYIVSRECTEWDHYSHCITAGLIRITDAESGRELLRLARDKRFLSVAYSLDGRRLVTVSSSPNDANEYKTFVRVWNARSGLEELQLQGDINGVRDAIYSPDGQRILTWGCERQTSDYCMSSTVWLWDALTGLPISQLQGHASWVWSGAFSPDGKQLVTVGADRTARVWNTESGHEVLRLQGFTSWVRSAAFSPDGEWIITTSGDGTARVWPATIERLVAMTEQLIQRDPPILTPKERQQYGLE